MTGFEVEESRSLVTEKNGAAAGIMTLSKNNVITSYNETLKQKDLEIEEKDLEIKEKDLEIEQRDRKIEKLEKKIRHLKHNITSSILYHQFTLDNIRKINSEI